MSRPALPFDLPLDRLIVRPWHDPVVEAVGHDPRSPYVERFWLALLGPSTTLLLRHLAAALEAAPEGVDLDLEDTARALGLGLRGGANSPFLRAIARTGQFHLARPDGAGAIAVRTKVQTLTHHQTERLPAALRDQHDAWLRAARAEPSDDDRRTRARRLALSLLELGESAEATEVQLHRWKIHPAMAHEALRWALDRTGRAAQATSAPVLVAAAGPAPGTADRAPGGAGPAGPLGRPGPLAHRPRPMVGPPGDAA